MFKRTDHRLGNLLGQAGFGIVRKPVVLSILIGKFRLEKKICSSDGPRAICGRQRLTNASFVILASLVGGINPAETCAERDLCQSCRAVFFPGGSVKKVR